MRILHDSYGVHLDSAVQDLEYDNVHIEGVVDIFKVAGIDKPKISILDDAFLQTFKGYPLENLRVRWLERAKEVIEQMIAIRQAMQSDDQRAQELGLTPEGIAFYDAVAANFMTIYD
jgi:type I restriction enzyme R subunit